MYLSGWSLIRCKWRIRYCLWRFLHQQFTYSPCSVSHEVQASERRENILHNRLRNDQKHERHAANCGSYFPLASDQRWAMYWLASWKSCLLISPPLQSHFPAVSRPIELTWHSKSCSKKFNGESLSVEGFPLLIGQVSLCRLHVLNISTIVWFVSLKLLLT